MSLLAENLISPVVLCFALGIFARAIRSDLAIPEPIQQGLSIYLLLAIGLKGGAALAVEPLAALLLPAVLTLALGGITPVSAYGLMRRIGRLERADAAAVAAHYGSVSVVTFLAAGEAVKRAGLTAEGYLPAMVALLEVPGIVIALLFASRAGSGGESSGGNWKKALHEVVTGKSIVLLLGGLVIGWLCGPEKLTDVQPFFATAFKGALCLFMIDLGLAAGKRLRDARLAGLRLLVLGCLIPVLHGALGVFGAVLAGLSEGGAVIFGAMAGSASYIAAPAAVRVALPRANPAYYLTLALGITFPFNLALGIPLFQELATLFHAWL
ncbi:MAG: sodium-dependent bicarbonate transport family permease [Verrucomicrobiales bacterium]|nr:sodium-dependent bicarbonate transport family permease [Verrucomicrobiales bacterium]